MTKTDWRAEETATAVRMWREGQSSTIIGKAINRPRNSVIGKMHRMKIERGAVLITIKPHKERSHKRRLKPKLVIVKTTMHEQLPPPRPPPDGVPFINLDEGMCRWMLDTPGYYCGDVTMYRKSYCTTHSEVMHIKAKAK